MSINNYNCGIYKIENLINGKCYIGQSIDLYKRKIRHFSYLENNKQDNIHLQNAYNKYGKNNFKFSILLYCEEFELTRYEIFFDNYYKNLNLSYNVRKCIDSNKGMILSNETKNRMSKAQKGRVITQEAREKMSKAKKGRMISEKTRKRISEALKGRPSPIKGKHLSEETLVKRQITREERGINYKGANNPFYGKHHSEKTKRKMSLNHADFSGRNHPLYGKHRSEKTKDRIRKSREEKYSGKNHPMYGKHHSEETKRRISESLKRRKNNSGC